MGAHTDVAPPGCLRGDRELPGEVGVGDVEHLRREHLDAASVEAAHLVFSVAHRRRGSDDQGANGLAIRKFPGGKGFHRNLEQADRGAERPGNEVQLVLDDQIRRAQPLDGTHSGRRVTADSRVAGGDGATGVIRVDVAVPAAAPADVAEQRRGFAFSG